MLLRTFCAFKAINFAVLLSAAAFRPFDNSSALLFSDDGSRFIRLLHPFVRWDAIYYYLIAKDGYVQEKMHAFYPLFPFLVKLISILLPFSAELNLLIAGVLICNLSHYVAYVSLYCLTLRLFNEQKLAIASSLFFLLQPASFHMTTLFAEGPFAALSISGMLALYTNCNALAGSLFFLSGLARSNGILLAGFFIYRLIFASKSKEHVARDAVLGLFSASGGIAYLYACFRKFCLHGSLESPEWCHYRIPNIYSHVQAKYWNVGAFKYYTMAQLPNFFIALPMIALSIYGLACNRHILLFQSKQRQLVPFYYLWLFLLLFSLVFVHIQVINRLFSFLPPVFWTMASIYQKLNGKNQKRMLSLLGIYYSSVSFMIACFYPPA